MVWCKQSSVSWCCVSFGNECRWTYFHCSAQWSCMHLKRYSFWSRTVSWRCGIRSRLNRWHACSIQNERTEHLWELSIRCGSRPSWDSGGILFSSILWRHIKSLSKSCHFKYLMGLSRFSRGRMTAKKLPRDLCVCSVNCSRVCFAVFKFFSSVSTVFWVSFSDLATSGCLTFILHFLWESHCKPQHLFFVVAALMTMSTNSTTRHGLKRIIFSPQSWQILLCAWYLRFKETNIFH